MNPRPISHHILLAILASASFATGAADIAIAPRGTHTTDYFGIQVADPYRALEDVEAPATRAWVDAQATSTRERLASLPGRRTLLAEYAAIDAQQRPAIPALQRSVGGTLFYLKRRFGETTNRLFVRLPGRTEKSLGDSAAVVAFTPSPDGRRVVIISADPRRNGAATLSVVDVMTNVQTVGVVDDAWSGATPGWMPDGRGFYYVATGGANDPWRIRAFRFDGTAVRTLVGWDATLAASDTVTLLSTEDGRLLFVVIQDRLSRATRVVFARIGNEATRWTTLIDTAADVQAVTVHGPYVYARAMAYATLGRIVRYDARVAKRGPIGVFAGADGGVLQDLVAAADGLYFSVRNGYDMRLARLPYGDRPTSPAWIALPYAGTIKSLTGNASRDGVVFGLEGWTHPATFFETHAGRVATLALQEAPSPIGQDWIAENLSCHGVDGVDIPMVAIHRKDLKKDGTNPLIMNGYGAYGFVESAYFYPKSDPWLQRGGVFVDFMSRGSGATGEAWHRAGMGPTKANSWKDLITCAETLINAGYTSADRLITQGVAIGGLMIGRAMTERPDLFAATVIRWGVTDPLRFIESPAHLPADEVEYGRPDSAAGVAQLLDQSIDRHLRDDVRYPAVMLTTGLKDTSFPPWLSFKTAARLATTRTASGRPVLLRVDPNGGARLPMSPDQRNEELADRIAFMLWIVGDPDFQPLR